MNNKKYKKELIDAYERGQKDYKDSLSGKWSHSELRRNELKEEFKQKLNVKDTEIIKFGKIKEKVVKDNIPLEEKEFLDILLKYKPTEIYHSYWSSNEPLWVITEYNDSGILYYSNSWPNEYRISKPKTYSNLYNHLRSQGLQYCFLKNNIL